MLSETDVVNPELATSPLIISADAEGEVCLYADRGEGGREWCG